MFFKSRFHYFKRHPNWQRNSQKQVQEKIEIRTRVRFNLCDLLSPLLRTEKKLRSHWHWVLFNANVFKSSKNHCILLQVPLSSSHGRWYGTTLPLEVLQNGHVCPWHRQSRILRQKWTSLCIRSRGQRSQTSRLRHQVKLSIFWDSLVKLKTNKKQSFTAHCSSIYFPRYRLFFKSLILDFQVLDWMIFMAAVPLYYCSKLWGLWALDILAPYCLAIFQLLSIIHMFLKTLEMRCFH